MGKPIKNIVLFSDGTGNSAAKLNKTNVWRMFESLDKTGSEQPLQVAMYDNGVGTSTFRIFAALGGVFGYGLKRNVRELYSFLCTQYDPECDNRIYIVGFSRGAFTARMLAALIGQEGILKVGYGKSDARPRELFRMAGIAYDQMTSAFPTINPLINLFRRTRYGLSRAVSNVSNVKDYEKISFYGGSRKNRGTWQKQSLEEQSDLHQPVKIRFLGIFDTVAAYGGPIEEITTAWSWLFFPMEPSDWNIGNYVQTVCHALAIDETRQSFRPKLINESVSTKWEDPAEQPQIETGNRLNQVWFAGSHSNIGGGYPNDGLSLVPFTWMVRQSEIAGMRFDTVKRTEFESARDCCAPYYDPRRGVGGGYRYQLRDMKKLTIDFRNNIYTDKPKIHRSVLDRIERLRDYAPIALNREFCVVDDEGTIIPATKSFPRFLYDDDVLDDDYEPTKYLPLDTGQRANPYIEGAWDRVWVKRIVYFLALAFALALILVPVFPNLGIIKKPDDVLNCSGIHCVLQKPLSVASSFLPTWTQTWVTAYKANIGVFSLLAGPLVILLYIGGLMNKRISVRLAQYWRWIMSDQGEDRPIPPRRGTVSKVRSRHGYMSFHSSLKHYIGPTLWAVVIFFFLMTAANQIPLYLRDHGLRNWAICQEPLIADARTDTVDISRLCNDTGADLKKGLVYRLTLRLKGDQDQAAKSWLDRGIVTNPDGTVEFFPDDITKQAYEPVLKYQRPVVLDVLSWGLRRDLSYGIFAPRLQIGQTIPSYVNIAESDKWLWNAEERNWSIIFESPASGRAYFYVNDVIIGWFPNVWQTFYKNNTGRAEVSIVESLT